MDIQDIAKSREKKAVFDMVLEEACRQWCDCIDDVPERKDGEGFADFFYEIFEVVLCQEKVQIKCNQFSLF